MSLLVCPECGSDKVTVAHVQAFMANTMDHYCHVTKTQDADSPSQCLGCGWKGQRDQLKTKEQATTGKRPKT